MTTLEKLTFTFDAKCTLLILLIPLSPCYPCLVRDFDFGLWGYCSHLVAKAREAVASQINETFTGLSTCSIRP